MSNTNNTTCINNINTDYKNLPFGTSKLQLVFFETISKYNRYSSGKLEHFCTNLSVAATYKYIYTHKHIKHTHKL